MYDPAGHVGVVFEVDAKGRIHFFDAHTDFSLTQMTYDLRFTRMKPSVGAGFKNWRPLRLVGYSKRADGVLTGGHIELTANPEIADFSDAQFFGNGIKPSDAGWKSGTFTLNGETLDYDDYVRAQMAGGKLIFEPVAEIADLARSNCTDLHYRAQSVALAIAHGIQTRAEPTRLPANIFGTDGDWEMYSTPSRDARLKTSFKYLRDTAQRFVEMAQRHDPHVSYDGSDIVSDLLRAYDRATRFCRISYNNSDGSRATLNYEDARSVSSRCHSIPINASSVAGATQMPQLAPTARPSARGMTLNRLCETSLSAPTTPKWTSRWMNSRHTSRAQPLHPTQTCVLI